MRYHWVGTLDGCGFETYQLEDERLVVYATVREAAKGGEEWIVTFPFFIRGGFDLEGAIERAEYVTGLDGKVDG